MNPIYLYFVNKLFLVGRYWDFKITLKKANMLVIEQCHVCNTVKPSVLLGSHFSMTVCVTSPEESDVTGF